METIIRLETSFTILLVIQFLSIGIGAITIERDFLLGLPVIAFNIITLCLHFLCYYDKLFIFGEALVTYSLIICVFIIGSGFFFQKNKNEDSNNESFLKYVRYWGLALIIECGILTFLQTFILSYK